MISLVQHIVNMSLCYEVISSFVIFAVVILIRCCKLLSALDAIFDALVLSKLRYAICVWSGFLSAELAGQKLQKKQISFHSRK